MYQKSKYVIFCFEGCHIILECGRVNFTVHGTQHFDNCIFKTIEIQINVGL